MHSTSRPTSTPGADMCIQVKRQRSRSIVLLNYSFACTIASPCCRLAIAHKDKPVNHVRRHHRLEPENRSQSQLKTTRPAWFTFEFALARTGQRSSNQTRHAEGRCCVGERQASGTETRKRAQVDADIAIRKSRFPRKRQPLRTVQAFVCRIAVPHYPSPSPPAGRS